MWGGRGGRGGRGACACGGGGGWGGGGGGGGVILGEVKARPKDIISFSLDYISTSKVQTSNPSSSPISLDTPARPADLQFLDVGQAVLKEIFEGCLGRVIASITADPARDDMKYFPKTLVSLVTLPREHSAPSPPTNKVFIPSLSVADSGPVVLQKRRAVHRRCKKLDRICVCCALAN